LPRRRTKCSVNTKLPASRTNRRRSKQQSAIFAEGGRCRERNSDCLGDHRCAGGVRNCRTRTGPGRTISFHPTWVRPQQRALPWVRATLRLRGILLRLPPGLRRHYHLLLLWTRLSRSAKGLSEAARSLALRRIPLTRARRRYMVAVMHRYLQRATGRLPVLGPQRRFAAPQQNVGIRW
jgi:hypothetical protein